MVRIFFFWSISLLPILTSGQYSMNPMIDTGMLSTWPDVVTFPPSISPNGKYVCYVINNDPIAYKTFVIKSTKGTWEKRIVTNNINNDYFFSKDSKWILWREADKLVMLDLAADTITSIPGIENLKFPRLEIGEWIAYRLKGSDQKLVLFNLLTNKKSELPAVQDFSFSDHGKVIMVKSVEGRDTNLITSIIWINLSDLDRRPKKIWSNGISHSVSYYSLDSQGEQIAFQVLKSNENVSESTIWYYKDGMQKAVIKASNKSPGMRSDLKIKNGAPVFSKNGKWIFFGLEEINSIKQKTSNKVLIDIWSYKDNILNPAQQSFNKFLNGVISITDSSILCIEKGDDRLETSDPRSVTGDFVVIRDNAYREFWWPHSSFSSYWLVSLIDGNRQLLKKESKYPVRDFSFSPGGRFLIYWDSQFNGYMCYDVFLRKSVILTKSLPPVSSEYDRGVFSQPVSSIAGWFKNDDALLIYDRYDIWSLDPSLKRPPINITNGYGAKNKVKLRLLYEYGASGFGLYDNNETLYLTGFNIINKYNGFFKIKLGVNSDPTVLTMGPYTYCIVPSQKSHVYSFGDGMTPLHSNGGDSAIWLVQRMNAIEYPNYFLSNDLIKFQAITTLEPQKKVNWLTAELINWRTFDGLNLQGILYKPENFNPTKKYPIIFNYYVTLSHRLYQFPWPGYCVDNINIPWFVSNGYLVFTPDIHFSIASKPGGKTSGEAAYNSIVSAAKYLKTLPYIDANRMGIQGHSFAGGLTNYLVTHCSLFAAAAEMAGGSDNISAYLTLRGGTCGNEMNSMQNEIGGSGWPAVGASPWERPDLYRRNSPVLSADKTITPLLIVHNKNDKAIPFRQGLEMYMALRRLGKKCWMLQYDDEGHSIENLSAQKDYTIRLTQFFNHFLKGVPAPKWMTESVPAKLKGLDMKYDVDLTGQRP